MSKIVDVLAIKNQLDEAFSKKQVDPVQLNRIAREVGRNLSTLSLLELATLRAVIASRRDSPDTTDYVKGLLNGILEISLAYGVQVEEDRHSKNVDRFTRGTCIQGKYILMRAVGNIQRNMIPTKDFEDHAKSCRKCWLVSKKLNRRLRSIKTL